CHPETISVAGAPAVPIVACESVHGPVLGQQGDTALALRDATRDGVATNLRAFLDLDRARSLPDFLAAGQDNVATLHLTYARKTGHMAYTHVGPGPVRRADDNRFLPHPGDGSAEWLGFLPRAALPLVIDPAQGWLANWNNKPQPGWTNSSDGFWQWGPVQRGQAIQRPAAAIGPRSATVGTLERVNRTTGLTAQTPPGADHNVLVPVLLPALLRAVDARGDRRLAAAVRLLRRWDQSQDDRDADGRFDSPALTVFTARYARFVEAAGGPTLAQPVAVRRRDKRTARLGNRPPAR